MTTSINPPLPEQTERDMRQARRLEWITIAALVSIVIVMGLTMGSSQAMRTAWLEDMLSLLPPVAFLIAIRLERKEATRLFPYGFDRTHSLASFASAGALLVLGSTLLIEAATTLIAQEHPTIGTFRLFGEEIWQGWAMVAALVYSVILPVILGRLKQPLARRLSDKVLHTDALMNKADWQTGLAGATGVIGVGFGLWWADAAAAGFISFSILKDGWNAFRQSVAELLDGAPRRLDAPDMDPTAERLTAALRQDYPDSRIQVRATGRYLRAVVEPEALPHLPAERARQLVGEDDAWRLIEVAIAERAPARADNERAGKLPGTPVTE